MKTALSVDNADVIAIVKQPVGGDYPGEVVPKYQDVACHTDGTKCRVKKDLNQIPEAMLRRWNDETRVLGPKTG